MLSAIMVFIPWTILPLRTLNWALESPNAELIIYTYAAFMIFSGIFSILAYTKGNIKTRSMQICTVINTLYALAAIAIICLSMLQ